MRCTNVGDELALHLRVSEVARVAPKDELGETAVGGLALESGMGDIHPKPDWSPAVEPS